jgi:transposase
VGAAAQDLAGACDAFADRALGRRRAQEHRDRRAARGRSSDGDQWRNRFAEQRLEGLLDEPRPGRPRTISDEQVDEVIVRTLETTPKDATHWSTRSMAKEVGLTQNAVLRIWHAFGLQPHRQDTFKLSSDPQFVEKVHDVVGLYLNPPERAVVLCVD